MTEPANAADKLSHLTQHLDQIRSQLADGNTETDVKSLEPEVADLLAALGHMPEEAAKAFQPQLEALIRDFGEVAAEYRRIMTAAESDVRRLNQTAKANEAYARSGAETAPRGKDAGKTGEQD